MADVRIRQAGEADADELARLRWDFTLEDHGQVPHEQPEAFFQRFRERWTAFCRSGRWTAWVAEADSGAGTRLVGCVWTETVDRVPRPVPHADQMGYLTNVYVEPAWRDRGIGTRLLRAAIADGRSRGYAELFVWPSARSVPYYRRAGLAPSTEVHELLLNDDA